MVHPGAGTPRVWRSAPGALSPSSPSRVYGSRQGAARTGASVSSITSITAPRPAVDWHSTSEDVERAPDEAFLPLDKVSLSSEARGELRRAGAAGGEAGPQAPEAGGRRAASGAEGRSGTTGAAAGTPGRTGQLGPEQQQEVRELQQRDGHVRAHEAAHQAAGGDLTGPASFSYRLGPDGRSYAVGGEVPLQPRSGRTPDETIAIARRVRAAALAPSDPSAADLAAAASASQLELRAMQQKRQHAPAAAPQADLERVLVRAPEAEPFL